MGFRLAFRQITTPPNDLNFTAPLTISENQPIGTAVGEFNATDPDAGATLTYQLVSGAGDMHNSLFTLDVNGTLNTAVTFDYETNASTYSIRVQVKDEFNATVEGSFTVILTDVYEPSQPNHTVDLNSTVNLEMIWVEPGTFTMGSPLSETGRYDNETEYNVTLTKGFYLAKNEVTQAQYERVMLGNDHNLSSTPSQFGGNPNRPVEKLVGTMFKFSFNDLMTKSLREYQQVGPMSYLRKPSGNMPAGQARRQYIHGAMISTLPMQTTIGMANGIQELIFSKPVMLACTVPTNGAFLTCMAMFLNGLRTGTGTIRSNPHWIPMVQIQEFTKLEEVVLGMTLVGGHVLIA